jgi:serine/threonine-protein kinase
MTASKTMPDLSIVGADPWIGAVLAGRYRILRCLDAGHMARVYVAEQLALGRNVAIKLVHEDAVHDDIALARFRHEVKVIARLRSPHTIQFIDAGELPDGGMFIAMELLIGETLRQRLERDGKMSAREVVELAAQIGASLDDAHDAGILHRDLKPDNVFLCSLSPRPLVKVLDFGLAKQLDADAATNLRITAPGRTVGTPAYMAPEAIVADGTVDRRADVYALGVMCFEMLTGMRPYDAANPLHVMVAHVSQPVPRISQLAHDLPPALDGVFDQLLAKRAEYRPMRASDVALLLGRALQ